jgi:hypothetical protein
MPLFKLTVAHDGDLLNTSFNASDMAAARAKAVDLACEEFRMDRSMFAESFGDDDCGDFDFFVGETDGFELEEHAQQDVNCSRCQGEGVEPAAVPRQPVKTRLDATLLVRDLLEGQPEITFVEDINRDDGRLGIITKCGAVFNIQMEICD